MKGPKFMSLKLPAGANRAYTALIMPSQWQEFDRRLRWDPSGRMRPHRNDRAPLDAVVALNPDEDLRSPRHHVFVRSLSELNPGVLVVREVVKSTNTMGCSVLGGTVTSTTPSAAFETCSARS